MKNEITLNCRELKIIKNVAEEMRQKEASLAKEDYLQCQK
jgi:hypothetical protein